MRCSWTCHFILVLIFKLSCILIFLVHKVRECAPKFSFLLPSFAITIQGSCPKHWEEFRDVSMKVKFLIKKLPMSLLFFISFSSKIHVNGYFLICNIKLMAQWSEINLACTHQTFGPLALILVKILIANTYFHNGANISYTPPSTFKLHYNMFAYVSFFSIVFQLTTLYTRTWIQLNGFHFIYSLGTYITSIVSVITHANFLHKHCSKFANTMIFCFHSNFPPLPTIWNLEKINHETKLVFI
jgi:hypothetical protein